jgi:hypothetical protein
VWQREDILEVARKVGGVWWLSGDVHFGTTGFVDPDLKPGEKRVGEVVMGPGGQWCAKPDNPSKLREKRKFIRKVADKKHMSFGTIESNYVVIDVNPAEQPENSTLDIYFYQAAKMRLHERRKYTGEVIFRKGNESGGNTALHKP